MAITALKISEMPLRSPLPLASCSSSPSSLNLIFFTASNPSFYILRTFSSLKTTTTTDQSSSGKWNSRTNWVDPKNPKPSSSRKSSKPSSSAPWPKKWPSAPANQNSAAATAESNGRLRNVGSVVGLADKDKGKKSIERIVLRLRNLGLDSDGEDDEDDEIGLDGQDTMPTGDEKLGDLLQREWIRPDYVLAEENSDDELALPWEREDEGGNVEQEVVRKRRVRAPTLAELTIEDEELRRLRRMGMFLRERISIPKAGLTQAVLEKIHDRWRKEELVRLKFHEVLAHDMKTAHEIVEVG